MAALASAALANGCVDAPSAVSVPDDATAPTSQEVGASAPCPLCPCITCYKIKDLGTLPGGSKSEALGISDSGVVVGWSNVLSGGTLPERAFRYQSGVMTDLGALPGDNMSRAYDVNNAGQIVGESWNSGNGVVRGFLWTPGQGMQDLGNLGGDNYTVARGINEAGWVAGESETANGASRAFLWTSSAGMQGTSGSGYDISDSGLVVGVKSSNDHAYRWKKLSVGLWMPTDLGTLGGCCSVAFGINTKGVIVGRSHDAQGGVRAFRWAANDGMTTLASVPSQAWAISDRDRVVGFANLGRGGYNAFTLRPSHPPGNPVYLIGLQPDELEIAVAVNTCGTIVGRASTSSSPNRAVIWTRSACDL